VKTVEIPLEKKRASFRKRRGDTTYFCILKSAKKVLLYISGPDEKKRSPSREISLSFQ